MRSAVRSLDVPARRAPRVEGALPLLGHALAFGRSPDSFVARAVERHGPVFEMVMPGGKRRILLLDPFDYPAYVGDARLRFHEAAAQIGGTVFGYDIERAKQHDMEPMSPMISQDLRGDPLQESSERMQRELVRRLFAALKGGSLEEPLFAMLSEHFFAAGTDALFGDGFYSKAVYERYAVVDRFFGLAVAGVPTALLPGFHAARRGLASDVLGLRPGHAMLFDRRIEFYKTVGIAPAEYGHIDASILWAAQANTVSAAFWTLRHLLSDPRAKAAVSEEVRSCAPGMQGAEPEPIGKDALRRMVLLDSACSEAMRLSSATMVLRRAAGPLEFALDSGGAISVDEGDELMLYPRHTHFDPELFPDPELYRFDRFVDDKGRPARFSKRGRRVTMPFLPFGGGVSMCPGRFFARNEIKILVATFLGVFDSELLSGALPALDFARVGLGVLPPLSDLPVRLSPRAPS